jgi:hypothetical protein
MIVAMAPRNVLVGRRPRKDAAAAPRAGPGDCGFRVAPEGPVLMDQATDVSHDSPQGRRPLDLRFRESDLAQQLVKARVAPCGQGSPGASQRRRRRPRPKPRRRREVSPWHGLPSEAAAFDGLDHAGTLEFVAVVADFLGCDTCDAL